MNPMLRNSFRYILAVLLFTLVSVSYFSPVLEGKKLFQNDIRHFTGMAKEINDFRDENGEEPYWTNAAFSGMPTFVLSAYYPYDFIKKLDSGLRFLPRPADYLFLYFLGFFILLLVMGGEFKTATAGALTFGFSTYLIIILGVGHNAKAHAIAYMPLVLAGILLVFRNRFFLGFILTALAMGLEINASHPQMTYYLMFAVLLLGLVEFVNAIRDKLLPELFKKVGIIALACALGVGMNASRLMATLEYSEYSTRGKSELTIEPDGSPKEATQGLDRSYITEYSYGLSETFNLFIPRFMGGGNFEDIGTESNTYSFLSERVDPAQARMFVRDAPTYWGQQPIVEAPAYIGAVMVFLFVLGLFTLTGKRKTWLVAVVIFSILLSWGKNFGLLTDLFINHVPLYNKFRAVSSIQVLAELAIPLMGILALDAFLKNKTTNEKKQVALKKAVFIAGGTAVLFMVLGGSLFHFEGLRDQSYEGMLPGLADAIVADRRSMMFNDSLRSLALVIGAAALLWLYLKKVIRGNLAMIGVVLLALIDLVAIDTNYVNKDDFRSKRAIDKPFTASEIDMAILEDKSHYRVANFTVDPMNDGSTSYFHNSIGGYFAAKLGRYNDLFYYQIARNNVEVLNMLNTKYFIYTGPDQKPALQENTDANGNAWLVSSLIRASNADEEMQALDSLPTKEVAVIGMDQPLEQLPTEYVVDSTAAITLTSVSSNALSYDFSAGSPQFAVFSEIYYPEGWQAYIDGDPAEHYRVNYALRGMLLPEGKHQIDFRFEPEVIEKGKALTLISYALLFLIPAGWFLTKKRRDHVS
jgi:hypothetical protein